MSIFLNLQITAAAACYSALTGSSYNGSIKLSFKACDAVGTLVNVSANVKNLFPTSEKLSWRGFVSADGYVNSTLGCDDFERAIPDCRALLINAGNYTLEVSILSPVHTEDWVGEEEEEFDILKITNTRKTALGKRLLVFEVIGLVFSGVGLFLGLVLMVLSQKRGNYQASGDAEVLTERLEPLVRPPR